MNMKKTGFIGVAVAWLAVGSAVSQTVPSGAVADAKGSIQKGLVWLAAQQKPSGAWSDESMPALTALPLWAFAASGTQSFGAEKEKAVAFLLGQQQPDGGIYKPAPGRKGGALGNYNTAISAMALYSTGRREALPAVLKARRYLAVSQHAGDDAHTGGFGYDRDAGRRYADLNNTHYAMDAMRRTQGAEELRPAGEPRADIHWDAALKYVLQMQNTETETAGGFAYNTQDPKGGLVTNANGRVMLRAYGSMTYAGLLAMAYAELDKGDPRVRSAVDFASRFWTLDENPGQGQQGLYFYFNIMARALTAAGQDALPRKGTSGEIRWREELIRKLVGLQKPDGSWANDNNRWWENDPVLATSYSLLALEFAAGLTR